MYRKGEAWSSVSLIAYGNEIKPQQINGCNLPAHIGFPIWVAEEQIALTRTVQKSPNTTCVHGLGGSTSN